MNPPALSTPAFEHHPSGLGVARCKPRISWRFLYSHETTPNWEQTSYDIEITPTSTGVPTIYHVKSEQSVLVPWPGVPLKSRDSATVKVRATGKSSEPHAQEESTPWSAPAKVEAGLFEKSDWKANFITSDSVVEGEGTLRPLRFRKVFELSAAPVLARLYITAHGVYQVYINGKLATDECMAPGWTSYKHRLNYRVLDVSPHLISGKNAIGIEVAEGWYAGRLGFRGGKRFWFGHELAVLAQLEVSLGDNSSLSVVTDDSWTCRSSPLLSSGIYDGEVYDHRQEFEWTTASANISEGNTATHAVRTLPWPSTQLVLPDAPPVRVIEQKSPENIFLSKSGQTILDFGQNLVGKLFIGSLHVPEGRTVTFKHAEVMEHGELGVRPLRLARCADSIIGSGREVLDWSPKFTFHGFRYVQVDGWPGTAMPTKDDLTALVMHSDMKRRGYFHTSNDSVNKLHQNVVWSMRGNFVSIPTDCPQRDERLGWTGDIQVFTPTASFLYDCTGLLGNWLEDFAAEQLEHDKGGIPPLVVPNTIPSNWPHIPQAVWDDAAVLTPAVLYDYSSDIDLIQRQFESMSVWLEKGVDRGPNRLWNDDLWQLADWLDPAAPPDDPGAARTDNVMVANAYLVKVTETFSRLCALLGKESEAKRYAQDAEQLKSEFQYKYITPGGNLMSNSQTGLSLAIQNNLYKGREQLQVAAASLAKLVRYARFRIATGFAGTPVICHALTSVGHTQLAYRMLLEKTCPSWMYPVTMGATTIWERWDSMLPNGDINPGQMTSFNHYALGAVADWLHATVGGISPLDAGWKKIRVRPIPGGNLTSAEVSFDGPYGQVKCNWRWNPVDNGKFSMQLSIPPNSTAVVTLPSELSPDGRCSGREEPQHVVGSGVHEYSCNFVAPQWPPAMLVAANQSPPEDQIAT
jgi:alpha-L-rhamnosidase